MIRFSCAPKQLLYAVLVLGVLIPSYPQKFLSDGKQTSLVVATYEKLVTAGAPLTPEGWKTVSALYESSGPYPQNGTIFLMSTGGALGENWSRDNTAEVETKWTDYFGSIDSNLRYKPPEYPHHVTMTIYQFRLHFTNKHREIDGSGKMVRETTGPSKWKMEGPLNRRWATIDRALEYVVRVRNSSNDPVIRRNAERTIRALKRLGGCGKNSAC